tara:strand:+ start:8317 stop:8634 length:318 start_codon:yes stop_codon:yes gene_type:complete
MATTNIDKQSFGQAGATALSGTETVAARWAALHSGETVPDICAIVALEDSVLHATNTVWPELTDSATKNLIGDTSPITIPKGVTIYGQFTAVGLDSGSVLCYHAA